MARLTRQNLNPNNLTYYDYNAYSRGRAYFSEGRVEISSFDEETAVCTVEGKNDTYIVTITGENQYRVSATCDCPQAARVPVCKHMIASLFALSQYVADVVQNRWQYRLNEILDTASEQKPGKEIKTRYAVVFGLLPDDRYYGSVAYRLLPFYIRSKDWRGVADLAAMTDQQLMNERLETDRTWTRTANQAVRPLDYRAVVNLPVEGVHLYNTLVKFGSFMYGMNDTDLTMTLPVLAKLNLPLFELASRNTFRRRLEFSPQPVKIEAAFTLDDQQFSLQAGITLNGQAFTTLKENLKILALDPAWVLAGRYVAPVQNPEALFVVERFPIQIPREDEQDFRQRFLLPLANVIPIRSDLISWQEVEAAPVPRLYLSDEQGTFKAALKFAYGGYEVDLDQKFEPQALVDVPGSWSMVRIHRQAEAEAEFQKMLAGARYGLKRAGTYLPGQYELRARTHPLDFLVNIIPQLTAAGFEIYGEESLKAGRINRNRPVVRLNLTSGQDWFDLNAFVQYGDQQVSMPEIRRALRKRERYIKLADGSIGQLPEEWVDRYRKLFDLAQETEDGLRVSEYHLPLVDELLDEAGESSLPAEYKARRERLQGYERIEPQPLPAGFQGELRPYQQAGVDWLHFLHEYKFGGCLADDMGLGKTIQVLAFLQLLKEQDKLAGPVLLVVPKSLLENWQREARRFTPALTILEYTGAGRSKDPGELHRSDIVMTTYQTMLRDIEFLRSIPFDYAILDESQAIKNPLAQVSKAARLLKPKHRLVMTGTPVENNTFELWSQFAFLNPGLLGSLDYFKREFAAPIESKEDKGAAGLLRKLVYPFILRRTKEQVAPELPPRTERILYVELEPPQRKLYNATKEYYRSTLLGLIDEQGMNNARMKILEGLLRLRQICIHPSIVSDAYRGRAAKFETLLDTLESLHTEGHKVLVFSQFVQTLRLVRKELDDRQLRYTYIDGQTRDRQEQVDRFQNDPAIPIFLISLKAGGVGLNLTAADYVIQLDPWWNPAVEMQAADRAHRIGQEKSVFIYKMIASGTVEEKILQLQERKKNLVEQLISSESSFFKSMTREDVQELFR